MSIFGTHFDKDPEEYDKPIIGRNWKNDNDDYDLDHIIPVSRGGSNELSNLGVSIPVANKSKSNLTLEEYLELCKKVLEHHGYTVTK